jgi:FMN reductase
MAKQLIAILGSVTPPGRMHRAVEAGLAGSAEFDSRLIDLRTCRVAFADGRAPEEYDDDTPSIIEHVTAADAVILASPVYRGTYTGALKNVLDHLPVQSLGDKPVGIVSMGYTVHHYLGIDWHLRDTLAWFGALVAPTSVYLSAADFHDGVPTDDVVGELASLIRTLSRLSELRSAGGPRLGPQPLAAKYL